MAVYTPLSCEQISTFLEEYSVGRLIEFFPVEEGTANTNFKLNTTTSSYMLTVFESEEEASQITWLPEYKQFLKKNGIPTAQIIPNKQSAYAGIIQNKKAVISQFLQGQSCSATPEKANQAGCMLGQLNKHSENYPHTATHPWCVEKLVKNLKAADEDKRSKYLTQVTKTLKSEAQNWHLDYSQLPSGVIHGDFFQDNVLFSNEEVSAVIDFYKAGADVLALDLAIALLDWGFDSGGAFNDDAFRSFLQGYNAERRLEHSETNALPSLLKQACCAVLIIRLRLSQTTSRKQRPLEPYLKRLEFLNRNNLQALLNG